MIPTVRLEDLEVGPRAEFAMRRENRGLTTQRVQAIKERVPDRWSWQIHYGADGMAASMSAGVERRFS